MKFTLTAVVLAISTMAAAAPHENALGRSSNGLRGQDSDAVRWHVPHSMTVKDAQAKCGDQAQLSCCNKATYAHDTTDINPGLGGGVLSNLIGSGSGAQGAGIFDQCSKLDVQIPIFIAVPIQDILNQRCKQNVACCAGSPSSASNDGVGVGLPCVALGSIL